MLYISTIALPAEFPRSHLQIMANDAGITGINFVTSPSHSHKENSWSKLAAQQLLAYFKQGLQQFSVPLVIHATPFQQQVWQQLQHIPYGKTVSYAEIAHQLGQPEACRAVGMANGKNPLPIIIPCHRVINKNGQLGGYSGGVEIKIALLALEGNLKQNQSGPDL